jgi:hypothetical protein
LKLLALLGLSAALAANDQTVWWRTEGGTVIQLHRNQQCALFLYDNEHGVAVSWTRDGTERLGVQDDDLHLVDGESVAMTARIDDTSIGLISPNGVEGYASAQLSQPIEPALREGRKITFKVGDRTVQFPLSHGKIPAMLAAVQKCRAQLK